MGHLELHKVADSYKHTLQIHLLLQCPWTRLWTVTCMPPPSSCNGLIRVGGHRIWPPEKPIGVAESNEEPYVAPVSRQATGSLRQIAVGSENVFCDPVLDLLDLQVHNQTRSN